MRLGSGPALSSQSELVLMDIKLLGKQSLRNYIFLQSLTMAVGN